MVLTDSVALAARRDLADRLKQSTKWRAVDAEHGGREVLKNYVLISFYDGLWP